MEQATELQLDRSDWQLVKFGDVAIQQKESVDRDNTELTRYVKGEHMGSEDLHIREWGELTDEYLGPAFIRKFEEGDILYGSRRTYLRKVVVAHFDGITLKPTKPRLTNGCCHSSCFQRALPNTRFVILKVR